jgi:hypothetical protein
VDIQYAAMETAKWLYDLKNRYWWQGQHYLLCVWNQGALLQWVPKEAARRTRIYCMSPKPCNNWRSCQRML